MTTHTLEKEKHSNFLAQNRIDPITGDLLKENDKIVICASCKSAFLVDSWEYMDKKHCNQRVTLKKVPINEVVRIERPYLIDLEDVKVVSRYVGATSSATPYFLISGILCFILYYFSIISKDVYAMQITSWSYMIMTAIFYIKSPYKKDLTIKNNILYFDEKNSSKNSIKVEDIKEIEVYKSQRHKFTNSIRGLYKKKQFLYTLKIIGKNHQEYSVLLEKKELERISKETNLLQKFNKNLPPSISVTKKIEQNRAN